MGAFLTVMGAISPVIVNVYNNGSVDINGCYKASCGVLDQVSYLILSIFDLFPPYLLFLTNAMYHHREKILSK